MSTPRNRQEGGRRPTRQSEGRRRRRGGRLPVATALAAVMALTGCASVGGPGSAPSSPAPGDDVVGEGVGGTERPLLQVEHSGGFVLMGWDFAGVPALTVYADGTAITHGPQIDIYPPPTLPNLLVQDLDDATVEALVAAARDAGLLDEESPGYGHPPVADAPTTFVTLHVDGRTYEHAAEALGMVDGDVDAGAAEGGVADDGGVMDGGVVDDGLVDGGAEPAPEQDLPGTEPMSGLTDEERAARSQLSSFITRAHELVGTTGEGEPYDIAAFAVMARPAPDDVAGGGVEGATEEPATPPAEGGLAGTMPAPDDGHQRQVFPWPLDLSLAEAEDCVLVDGEQAVTLREVLANGSFTTQYEQAGTRYDVWFRPLLPHESGCDDV